jgi:hypothetical protein
MSNRNSKILIVGLLMIGGFAAGMTYLRTHQKLGKPGIITSTIPGSERLDIYVPRRVLDYGAVVMPTDPGLLRGLPQDTSFAQRYFLHAPDLEAMKTPTGELDLIERNQYPLEFNIVLMGTDRTSIHKPQYCLRAAGWDIDFGKSSLDTVHIEGPHPYDLQIMKLMTTRAIEIGGKQTNVSGIYVYWFVADHELTADHLTRMKKMAVHLLTTGELQRWAYVSMLGVSPSGGEDVMYDRMKKFIAAAVPQFQTASEMTVASSSEPAAP